MAVLMFQSDQYELVFHADRPFVTLKTPDGQVLFDLFAASAVHAAQGRDDCTRMGEWVRGEQDGAAVFTLRLESAFWQSKTVRFLCEPERFTYALEVEGKGDVSEVQYFGGYFSAIPRWGSGFFPSAQGVLRGFFPEPETAENHYFSPDSSAKIDLIGVPLPGRGDWFFTPPPFCYAFEYNDTSWIGAGLEAPAEQNYYHQLTYRGQPGGFYLSLLYEGKPSIDGRYALPSIGFDFASTEYEALAKHVAALRRQGLVPAAAHKARPDWWHAPIFCGWGSQCYLASLEGGRAPDFSRQALYDGFLSALDAHDVNPGVVVLDDKWQASYGENEVDPEKWPDLPGFIAAQHAQGRKVLLWLKAWDPEGLPAEECARNAAGLPIAFDPTHPKFEARLRASVRRMLSAEGYDADGFKIDFTARIPVGPGIQLYGEARGLELMKAYLRILHEEAKAVKSDALIMAHTPHPYLADVLDMIRLNDINTGQPVNPAMIHRARVASIACPNAVIDTDNWPMPNRTAWREYLPLQAELGVPSLYFATHIDATGEPLEEEDYQLIRETWAAAKKRLSDR
ncbi:MAG: hypothetical protein JW750_04070 [Anaerolineaceae bacterium]|nr:hypothetical protein [Anaerolineaceae bacterium]